MNYEKLREMEWFVEFERKFGMVDRDISKKPIKSVIDNTKMLCIDRSMCNALISSDINLEDKAIEIITAEPIVDALSMFKSLKINDGELLVFKENYPAVLFSPSERKGILIAPRIV